MLSSFLPESAEAIMRRSKSHITGGGISLNHRTSPELDHKIRLGLVGRESDAFPSPCKHLSVNAAHTLNDIDQTIAALRRVVKKLTAKH